MNFVFHTTPAAVGNILRVHYKSMMFHFHNVAQVHYLGKMNMFFIYA